MLSDRINEALPQHHGFIRSYVEYAAQCSDAPEVYHCGVALTVLAGAIAHKLTTPFVAGRPLTPNLYTLLVGPSRASRKTSSMDAGIDVLRIVDSKRVIPIPGSYEEMIVQIRSTPAGLLTYREFGHFLKTTQRGYGEPIRTALMDLYDHPADRPYERNLRKAKTIIEPPICLSMLSSIATDLLFAFSDTDDWTGGFLGRMLLLYGERDTFKMPVTWTTARSHCAVLLHRLAGYSIPTCGGFAPAAWDEFSRWSQWRDAQTTSAPARLQTHISGISTMAAKVAMLYGADNQESQAGNGWLISHESMRRAILFAEKVYMPSIMHLGDRLALGIWERDRRRVLDLVEQRGQIGITRRDLLRLVRMESNYLETIVSTLREEGTVVSGSGARDGQPTYRVAQSGAAAARMAAGEGP